MSSTAQTSLVTGFAFGSATVLACSLCSPISAATSLCLGIFVGVLSGASHENTMELREVRNLTRQIQGDEDQIEAFLLRFPRHERADLTDQVVQLQEVGASPGERYLQILRGIPDQGARGTLVQQMRSLHLPTTPEALETLANVDEAERPLLVSHLNLLLAPSTSYPLEERAEFGRGTSEIFRNFSLQPPDQRTRLIEYFHQLVTPDMSAREKKEIAEKLLGIHAHEREELVSAIAILARPDDAKDLRIQIIDAFLNMPRGNRLNAAHGAQRIAQSLRINLSSDQTIAMIGIASRVANFENFIAHANSLTSFWMNQGSRIRVYQKLSELSPEQQGAAKRCVKCWMGLESRLRIMETCREVHHVNILSAEASMRVWMRVQTRIQMIDAFASSPRPVELEVHLRHLGMFRFDMVHSATREVDRQIEADIREAQDQIAARDRALAMWLQEAKDRADAGRLLDARWQALRLRAEILMRAGYAVDSPSLEVDTAVLESSPVTVLLNVMDTVEARGRFPRICYRNEEVANVGVDVGGLTRDFVTKLFENLCSHEEPRKLSMAVSGDYLLPQIKDGEEVSLQDQIKSYRAIGMIFAYALQNHQDIRIGNHFHPTLYEMLHAISPAEIAQLPPSINGIGDVPEAIYKKLLKIHLKANHASAFLQGLGEAPSAEALRDYNAKLNAAVEAFVERGVINEWMGFAGVESKAEFLQDHKIDAALHGALVIAQSMHQHQNGIAIAAQTPKDLRDQVEGILTKEKVILALGLNCLVLNEQQRFLRNWIDQAPDDLLKRFVWGISGSTSLPAQARFGCNVTGADAERLPDFHTCGKYMDIPAYSNYPLFKTKLEQALANLQGNGGFQFA